MKSVIKTGHSTKVGLGGSNKMTNVNQTQMYSWSDKYFLYCYTDSKNRSLNCVGIYSSVLSKAR